MTPFSTPVLFIVFNRPDTTQQVFNAIRQAKPKKLFIAADGPRPNRSGETEKCEIVKAIVQQVDWECEVKTLFRTENLGCAKGPMTAITWFFEHVEEGIILEDDCLPHPSFFFYCQELLKYYRDNEKVMLIGGNQHLQDSIVMDMEYSYYFSAINYTWGWATWKTTWQKYKFDLNDIPRCHLKQCLKLYFKNRNIHRAWLWYYEMVKNSFLNTCWDYQLTFSIWTNKGLCIAPFKNLVSNIGFGEDATHTFNDSTGNEANMATSDIGTLKHPTSIVQNRQIDETYCTNEGYSVGWIKYIYRMSRLYARKIYKGKR